ncbi:MAG TPA: methyltransferase domain-containing protein, partial [Patescibacteria group bacterium]|nr:methyltransferase domain-containing protein [Patescibacteria group bacterium]
MTVADLGCGSGFYVIPAAQLVGPEGTVYGLDSV